MTQPGTYRGTGRRFVHVFNPGTCLLAHTETSLVSLMGTVTLRDIKKDTRTWNTRRTHPDTTTTLALTQHHTLTSTGTHAQDGTHSHKTRSLLPSVVQEFIPVQPDNPLNQGRERQAAPNHKKQDDLKEKERKIDRPRVFLSAFLLKRINNEKQRNVVARLRFWLPRACIRQAHHSCNSRQPTSQTTNKSQKTNDQKDADSKTTINGHAIPMSATHVTTPPHLLYTPPLPPRP